MRELKEGDKVAYSVQFLDSIGMPHSDLAQARGTILKIHRHTDTLALAEIKWNGDFPLKVNVKNLALVGPNIKFCKC